MSYKDMTEYSEITKESIQYWIECDYCDNKLERSDNIATMIELANYCGWKEKHTGHGNTHVMCSDCFKLNELYRKKQKEEG